MKKNQLKSIIMLLAAILVSVFNVIQKYTVARFSYTLLIVLIVFYVLGSLIQKVVNNIINKDIAQKEKQEIERNRINENKTENDSVLNEGKNE